MTRELIAVTTPRCQHETMASCSGRSRPWDLRAITLVLDNAAINASCGAALAEQLGITLLYLPSYSPNLNLIERLWKSSNIHLYGHYHPNFARSSRSKRYSTVFNHSRRNAEVADDAQVKAQLPAERHRVADVVARLQDEFVPM